MDRMVRTSELHIPWLTDLPDHWDVTRSKNLFTPRKEKARPDDQQLSATQAYGVIPQKEFERRVGRRVVQITQHLEKREHVERDDFVISMRSFQGGLERAWANGCIRSSYVVLKPSLNVHVGYFSYLLKSDGYIQALQATSNFIRDGQDLKFSNFCLVDLPVVRLEEQRTIAKYLDVADRRIRRYIKVKRRLIALLNEQKQAIIHKAVICGLDPNARLKPSGIEWLGDVPERWAVRRISWLFDERNERGRPGLPILAVSLRTGVTVGAEYDENGKPRRLIENVTGYKYAARGDIAYNMMRMWQGAVGLVPVSGLVSPAYVVARPRDGVLSSYFELLFRTEDCKNEINRNSRGIVSDRNRLYWDDFKRLYLLLPPPEEQQAIVGHVERETGALAAVIDRAHREMALLLEFRTRLIADVVTGKLDVREAAARLPDEADEQDVFDDAEVLAEDVEATDDADLDAVPEEAEV